MCRSALSIGILLLVVVAGCGTTDDAEALPFDIESASFDDVLGVWNADSTGDVALVYAPDAEVIEIESVTARGIEEIGTVSADGRNEGYCAKRITAPTVVFETQAGDRYAVAAIESHETEASDGALEIVVLEWTGDYVVSHWWLQVPAAEGTFRAEDDLDAVGSARLMTQAWNSLDNTAALDIYAPDVRVYWWGSSEPVGMEDLLSNLEGARSISNRYEDVATPMVLTDERSGRVFTVNVSNVTGPGHTNGSLVIAVSELHDGKVIAWTPFLVEDLPVGRTENAPQGTQGG